MWVSLMAAFGRWTLLLYVDGSGLGGGESELCSLVRLGTLCCLLRILLVESSVGWSVGMSVSSTTVLGEGELEACAQLQEWPVGKMSPTGSVWVALSVVVDLRAPPLLRRGSRAGLGVSFSESVEQVMLWCGSLRGLGGSDGVGSLAYVEIGEDGLFLLFLASGTGLRRRLFGVFVMAEVSLAFV